MSNKWRSKKLKDLAMISYGKSPKNILAEDGSIPIFGTGGIERFGKDYMYDGESIILGRKGTIDNPVYVNGKFWAIDTTYFLQGFKDSDIKWLYYFLLTINFRSMNEATGVPSLARDYLYSIEVDTPPKEDQICIASVLYCIDCAIEQTEALIAKQQRVKLGLMQDLLTRGIDEHGNIRSEATQEFKDSQLGRIPREWDVIKLDKELLDIEQGWSPDCEPFSAQTGEWGVLKTTAVAWEGYNDAENKRLPHKLKPKTQYEVKAGDILMTRGGPNSRVGVVVFVEKTQPNLMLSDKLYRLVPSKSFEPAFLVLSLSGNYTQRHLSTLKTGLAESQTNISQEIVKNLLTVRPPKDEQKLIVKIARQIEISLKRETEKLNKLRKLKVGLMQDLLTGKVSVESLLEVNAGVDA